MPKMGRPPKFTREVVQQIADKIAKGLSDEHACALLGYSFKTWHHARKKHPDIINKAHGEFRDRALSDIRAGSKGWQGAAWILERCHGYQNKAPVVAVQTVISGLDLDSVAEIRTRASERTRNEIPAAPTANKVKDNRLLLPQYANTSPIPPPELLQEPVPEKVV